MANPLLKATIADRLECGLFNIDHPDVRVSSVRYRLVHANVSGRRRPYLVKITPSPRPSPPDPTALTVATYVPGARLLKNVARSTVMSPLAAGVGLPRSEKATRLAVAGSEPSGKMSSRYEFTRVL